MDNVKPGDIRIYNAGCTDCPYCGLVEVISVNSKTLIAEVQILNGKQFHGSNTSAQSKHLFELDTE